MTVDQVIRLVWYFGGWGGKGGEVEGGLMAARSEAGPETWKYGWLRRFLLLGCGTW